MAKAHQPNNLLPQIGSRLSDLAVTLICWTYFTFGFILFFSPGYVLAYLFSSQREIRFQRLTCIFFRGFFCIVRALAPRHQWKIDPRIAAIKSAVLVCNHLSYLDPLLFISLLERQKTIVKTKFFKVPVFGWFIRNAGYLPADAEGKFAGMMIHQVEQMEDYLNHGGNLFVFPEGTRSRNGKIGNLNRGSLKIARLYRAPIYVLRLTGTDRMFTPGKFFFNTQIKNTIRLSIADHIEADSSQSLSLAELEERIRKTLRRESVDAAPESI